MLWTFELLVQIGRVLGPPPPPSSPPNLPCLEPHNCFFPSLRRTHSLFCLTLLTFGLLIHHPREANRQPTIGPCTPSVLDMQKHAECHSSFSSWMASFSFFSSSTFTSLSGSAVAAAAAAAGSSTLLASLAVPCPPLLCREVCCPHPSIHPSTKDSSSRLFSSLPPLHLAPLSGSSLF